MLIKKLLKFQCFRGIYYRNNTTEVKMLKHKGICPLLINPDSYVPDTLDLLTDKEAREYWLDTVESLVEKYVQLAVRGAEVDESLIRRAKQFKMCFIDVVHELKLNPASRGSLTIRSLLELSEVCLRSQGFTDLWKQQKMLENNAALDAYIERINTIDNISDFRLKWTELAKGVLAGNMFDWGATAVTKLMEENANFGLNEALGKIQRRPWLFDDLEHWIDRIQQSKYKCAAVFVDNSGVDVVLGIMPFIRQVLLQNTQVIMCANESPSLNDVTHIELKDLLIRISDVDSVVGDAVQDGSLVVRSSGQHGPCLDLKTLDSDLCEELKTRDVDLIILEGMGRALHTNLNTRLICDTLKMAVVKNTWLANRLGGPLFSGVFLYQLGDS